MSNKMFSIGDWVEVLDDAIKGRVVKINHPLFTIETKDGFELDYAAHELILSGDENIIREASRRGVVEDAKAEKVTVKHHRVNAGKKSRKDEMVLEVDLHIEKLVNNFSRMSNFDILNLQVDTARSQLEFAIKNRIPKLILIHGMGEGVLKAELEFLLGRYPEVVFQDANYRKYGLGATEVYIKQNV